MAELGFEQGFSDFERPDWEGTEFHFRSNRSCPDRSKHEVCRVWAKPNDRDLCLGDPEVESEVGLRSPRTAQGVSRWLLGFRRGLPVRQGPANSAQKPGQGQHQTAGALGRRGQRVATRWSMTDPVSDCLAS